MRATFGGVGLGRTSVSTRLQLVKGAHEHLRHNKAYLGNYNMNVQNLTVANSTGLVNSNY